MYCSLCVDLGVEVSYHLCGGTVTSEWDHPLDRGGSKDGLKDQLSLEAPPTIRKRGG